MRCRYPIYIRKVVVEEVEAEELPDEEDVEKVEKVPACPAATLTCFVAKELLGKRSLLPHSKPTSSIMLEH